jgi:hypothetical protein
MAKMAMQIYCLSIFTLTGGVTGTGNELIDADWSSYYENSARDESPREEAGDRPQIAQDFLNSEKPSTY